MSLRDYAVEFDHTLRLGDAALDVAVCASVDLVAQIATLGDIVVAGGRRLSQQHREELERAAVEHALDLWGDR